MSNLAFSASPIDFKINNEIEKKINKNKLNSDMLNKIKNENDKKNLGDVSKIHENLEKNIKNENEDTLANFYSNELTKDMSNIESKQVLHQNNNVSNDYMISNNLNLDKINHMYKSGNRDELLEKLNYIINLFENEKEIKTNKKNEEVVLYCFLGIFIIYVLDSFVSIGKYKR
uniref:Uncharacterized protein n=1 Tax=Florenciella sp. virus SA2 TaxID=3240092 RepID=A0AB39JDL7_9VIRU